MQVIGLQIQSNNQRQLFFPQGRSAQRGLYHVKGQDQGDLEALDAFMPAYPGGYIARALGTSVTQITLQMI